MFIVSDDPEPVPAKVAPSRFDPLVKHYESCFNRHGATPGGVDWPNGVDLEARFATMLKVAEGLDRRPVLLDLGCGPGLLLDYLRASNLLDTVDYRGIDLSFQMIATARRRWPNHRFSRRDIVTDPLDPESIDVVVMNGVLTERRSISQSDMITMAQTLIAAAFRASRVGVAFNVMSSHVDWPREELFHWPFDEMAGFLTSNISRHFAIRADYGLYEYTVTVCRKPYRPIPLDPPEWWQR